MNDTLYDSKLIGLIWRLYLDMDLAKRHLTALIPVIQFSAVAQYSSVVTVQYQHL